MNMPIPTPIDRLTHVDNLAVCMQRQAIYAPMYRPNDTLAHKSIHNSEMQQRRTATRIPCGPGGTIHDYVPFYFGYLSPMLLQLRTGRVAGYGEGQEPLIYFVSSVQAVSESRQPFVFSDGHGIAFNTRWYDTLESLYKVDWGMVYQRYWKDTVDDMDRQRRKQAEFLIYQRCNWNLICEIGVISSYMKTRVQQIMAGFPATSQKPVNIRSNWYYH